MSVTIGFSLLSYSTWHLVSAQYIGREGANERKEKEEKRRGGEGRQSGQKERTYTGSGAEQPSEPSPKATSKNSHSILSTWTWVPAGGAQGS